MLLGMRSARVASVGQAPTFTAFSSPSLVGSETLSNGNRTVTFGSGDNVAKSVASIPTGGYYYEVHVDTLFDYFGIGIALATAAGSIGFDDNGKGFATYNNGTMWRAGSQQISGGAPSFSVNATMGVCIKNNGNGTGKIWWTLDGVNFFDDVSNLRTAANVAAGVGGVAIDIALAAGPIYAACGTLSASGSVVATANFGASSYSYAPPSGFVSIPG